MSEDIKQSEETQEIEETAATSQEESSELDENQSKNVEEESPEQTEEKPDEYTKALEAELGRAKKKIVDLKKSKPLDVDTDAMREAVRTEVRLGLEASRAEEIGTTVDDFISQLSTTPSEQALIKFHYDNTINRSGTNKQNIFQDLTRAKLIANESKLVSENAELKKALMSRKSISSPQFSGKPMREERNPLTDAEKAMIKGMKLNEAYIIKKLKK